MASPGAVRRWVGIVQKTEFLRSESSVTTSVRRCGPPALFSAMSSGNRTSWNEVIDYLLKNPDMTRPEPSRVHCRFGAMDEPEIVFHTALLVIGVLGIFISLAGIAFWWVSRKMNRLT